MTQLILFMKEDVLVSQSSLQFSSDCGYFGFEGLKTKPKDDVPLRAERAGNICGHALKIVLKCISEYFLQSFLAIV